MSQIFNTKYFNVGNKPSKNVLVNTDQGSMIVNRFDFDLHEVGHSRWLLDHGNCNTLEVNDCFQAIKDVTNPIVFDVGANIGTISIWLSRILTLGHVYSFEAQPQIFYQLAGNVALNNLYNIDVFNYAVGSEEGYITFNEPNYFSNYDFGTFSLLKEKIPSSNKKSTVQCVTLDNFITRFKIPKVDLLKIDVEGMDLEVLKGSVNILNNFAPAIYIEHFDNTTSMLNEIKEFLSEFNYSYDLRKNNLLCMK